MKAVKGISVAVLVIGLCTFFFVLILGIIVPVEPVIAGNFFSDNWLHTPHPALALISFLALVFILTPPFKQMFSPKKEEKRGA